MDKLIREIANIYPEIDMEIALRLRLEENGIRYQEAYFDLVKAIQEDDEESLLLTS